MRVGDTELPYTVARSRRRRRTVAFGVDPGPVLTVRAPQSATLKSIEELASENARWILRRIDELKERGVVSAEPRQYVSGEVVPYLGRRYRLDVVPALGAEARCVLRRGFMELHLPVALSPDDVIEAGKAAVTAWFESRAAARFPERVAIWSRKLKVRPGRTIVTSPQHRWGSCDARNNIRLNWRILMAPLALVDYVVAHELAHVVHKNHGARFWRKLEKAMPDYRERRDTLQEIGQELTL